MRDLSQRPRCDVVTATPHQEISASRVRQFARWSPDGKRLRYQRILERESEIIISCASGGGEDSVRKSPSQPCWLSDSAILIADVAAFVEIDTLGQELTRLRIPDVLSGELISGGGMSRVFVADELRLQRKVVVKILSPELAQSFGVNRKSVKRKTDQA